MFDEFYDVCAHEHRKINEWYIRDVENVASLLETFFFYSLYSWRRAAFSVIVIMGLDFLLLPSLLCTTQPSDDVK